ncbi:MAG: sulfatase-like hydrolase/transferase [bacterium]|nr:sulfatase-like hydrolase/transferase [bacterium]
MTKPRNVLFILADQFRADSLGCVGHPVVQTPHLDMLAREGTLFRQCFVQTAPCGPSRMCMFTSRYACSHRSVGNKVPLVDAQENLGIYLREAGYKPGQLGYQDYAVDPRILAPDDFRTYTPNYDNFLPGWDVLLDHEYDSKEYFAYLRGKGYGEELCNHRAIHEPNVPPEGPGEHLAIRFPAHYKEEDCECRFVTNRAIEYFSARANGGWVLNINYIKPHPPRICSAPYNDMYDPADMPTAVRRSSELESDHPYLEQVFRKPSLGPERDLRETQANYWGMITELDTSLGILFAALKESGQWDNTLIVFSSDHGEYLGDHYLTGKGQFFDGTMRVPLIIRDPSPEANGTRGKQLDGFVESIDHAPTILSYLDIQVPDRFQGKSVLDRVRGAGSGKSEIFYEKDIRGEVGDRIDDPDRALLWVVRDAAYKYVQFGDEYMPSLLYDLEADPGEFHNLAEDPAHLATVLTYCQKLLRWRMKHEDQRATHWAASHASG